MLFIGSSLIAVVYTLECILHFFSHLPYIINNLLVRLLLLVQFIFPIGYIFEYLFSFIFKSFHHHTFQFVIHCLQFVLGDLSSIPDVLFHLLGQHLIHFDGHLILNFDCFLFISYDILFFCWEAEVFEMRMIITIMSFFLIQLSVWILVYIVFICSTQNFHFLIFK